MYSGNDGMINMLREFGGIPADALSALSGTFSDAADSLDRFAGRTGTAAAAVQSVSGALNEVAGADISSPIPPMQNTAPAAVPAALSVPLKKPGKQRRKSLASSTVTGRLEASAGWAG